MQSSVLQNDATFQETKIQPFHTNTDVYQMHRMSRELVNKPNLSKNLLHLSGHILGVNF